VRTIGTDGALWIIASGHSVWLDASRVPERSLMWRLNGPDGTHAYHVTNRTTTPLQLQLSLGEPTYAGSTTGGVWQVVMGEDNERIIEISPSTGAAHAVATMTTPFTTIYSSHRPLCSAASSSSSARRPSTE